MTTSFPPISYPSKPVPPFSAPAPRNPFPGFFPDMWRNITGKPYITVSSKGLANGLSEYFNDGADFGPDSLQADGSLTTTCGVLEAWNYAIVNKIGIIKVKSGNYYIYSPLYLIMDREIITIEGDLNYGYDLSSTTNFPVFVNKTTGSNPYIQIGSTSGSTAGIPFGLSKIGFLGNNTASDGIVTVNVQNLWNNVNTANFSSKYGVQIIGAGNLHIYRDCWINGDNSVSGNSVFRVDGIDTVSSYTIGTTEITVEGRPEIYMPGTQIAGNVSSYETGTVGLDIADANLFGSPYIHIRNVETLILDENAYVGVGNQNVITTLYPENFTTLITANGKSGSSWLILQTNVGASLTQTANFSNGNIVRIIPNPVVALSPSLSANPPVSATVYQNTNPYDIEIDLPVYATTAGTAGYVTIAKGSTSTPTAIGNQFVSGSTSSTSTEIIKLRVPTGWYYSFTGSGVTFATATPFAE